MLLNAEAMVSPTWSAVCTALAEANLFMPPPEAPQGDLGVFDWAVHFDASLFARFLAARAKAAGVAHIDAKVEGVGLDGESGNIAALTLEGGPPPASQLTGPRSSRSTRPGPISSPS